MDAETRRHHSIFSVTEVMYSAFDKEVLMVAGVARLAVLLIIVGLVAAACGPRRLNVMYTPQQTLMTIGYSADRSQSIFRADNEAQLYCKRRHQGVVFLNQDTIYQGRYNEDVTAGARTAGRVAGALGSSKAAAASRALSSPTDYKTTFEFQCR
jgi:hypothetical protein